MWGPDRVTLAPRAAMMPRMPPRFATVVGSMRWIISLAGLTAVVALSIDMSLPAQPTLARTFGVSSETAQLTLSLFLIGFALAQLVVGYLSDAWGRRRVILGGLAMFSVASIACAASPSIEVLLACRVLQGVGAAAAPVVARAMVRDTQPAAQAARLLSTMLAALAIAPMIAPVFGGWLLHIAGWRSIFAALAVTGTIMFALAHLTLVETLAVERRQPASPRGLVRSYARFFTTRGTRLPMLVSCAVFAGQFAYIADSPFVLMGGYGVSPDSFGFYFAMTALALMLGSLAGGRMLRAGRSPGAMLVLGAWLLVTGGVLVVIGTRTEALGIAGFLIPMIIYFFGAGLTSPSATALALEPVPQIAGTASAVMGCATVISGALAGYETTRIGGSSPTTFAAVVLVMAVLVLGFASAAAVLRRRAA
ncbi:MAG: drug resistance transporter, Bcr/CflA subfamily [Deltaproteobacteria bacterium]|nr:drug resistance transporter, Bcr/CflA subfamily [Deltaproteobacteria bacterium]